MKNAYRWVQPLLAALLLLIAGRAGAQTAWRPFRPRLIYSYAQLNGPTGMHTLRVDSAYQSAGGDSVYAFNRLMRRQTNPASNGSYVKSRNNLFGARLSWTQGQNAYVLEGDAQLGVQAGVKLRIYPRAAVGRPWTASTTPLLTAMVGSRRRATIQPGVQDSVITVNVWPGAVIAGPSLLDFDLSRDHGLVGGAAWLGAVGAGTPASSTVLAALPVPLAQSPYSPLALFTMQPGDELGYFTDPFTLQPAPCSQAYTLRRILARQQTADSLVITYREQTRIVNFGWSFCFPMTASTTTGPVQTGRLAFSLRTGRSPQYPALGLLSGEYGPDLIAFRSHIIGLGVAATSGSGCISSGAQLPFLRLYPNPTSGSGPVTYSPGLDYLSWYQYFGPVQGMGEISTGSTSLVYYRRSTGTPLVCGSFTNFADLLPTRATQTAAVATLHPNPAAEQATLTLAAAARPGTALRLTDALGRTVWTAPVLAGRTALPVSLAGQPAGLYLLHLSDPGGASATWKLLHE